VRLGTCRTSRVSPQRCWLLRLSLRGKPEMR